MEKDEKKFNSFTDLNPFEYQGLLITVNLNYQEELRRSLTFLEGKLTGICLILTGSDGKQERHCQSKTEIIILGRDGIQSEKVRDELYKQIHEQFSLECDLYTGLSEIKLVGNFMAYAYDDPNLVFPDRILHSAFLLGDHNLFIEARLKALEELKEQRVGEHLKEQLKFYQRAIETGVYRHQLIFDEKEGVQYYEENDKPKLLRLGFKPAFLRAVQRKLDLLTRKGVFNRQLEERIKQRYAEGLSNTSERIEFLSEIGLILHEMVKPLTEAYYWFLQQYHRAQEQYKNTRELVELPFDHDLFNKHRQTILEFLKI